MQTLNNLTFWLGKIVTVMLLVCYRYEGKG